MIKNKYIKSVFAYGAIFCFLTGMSDSVMAGAFTDPADNAYSLKKVFTRPYLQNTPIPKVWQVDASSPNFKGALLDSLTPQTQTELQLDSLLRELDALDRQNDYRNMAVVSPFFDMKAVTRLLNEMVPVVEQVQRETLSDLKEVEKRSERYQQESLKTEETQFNQSLVDLSSFFASLSETARMDVEMDFLEKSLEDTCETQMLFDLNNSFLSENILSKAENIHLSETEDVQIRNQTEEIFYSLLINDMMDLSTGIGTFEQDSSFFAPDDNKNISKSASLLDRTNKTDQIQNDDPASKKQSLFKKLEKFLKKK